MNDYLQRHKTLYGYDKCIVAINDKIEDYFFNLIINLGFNHIWDDEKITLDVVKKEKINGFCRIKNGLNVDYKLYISKENLQKNRESVLEIFVKMKKQFENIGIFLMDFANYNMQKFYLITYNSANVFVPVFSSVYETYAEISVSHIFKMLINDLPSIFNPYIFAYVIQNKNRSEMSKIDKQLSAIKGYKLKENDFNMQLQESKSNQNEIIVISSVSLIKKDKFRIILCDNSLDYQEISSKDLVDYLNKTKEKITVRKYYDNMQKTYDYLSSNLIEKKYICSTCVKKIDNANLFVDFIQNNDTKCQICNKNIGSKFLNFKIDNSL